MGIVSSTFASLAIQFAWNCQRFLDPRYRSIEASDTKKSNDKMADVHMRKGMNSEPMKKDGAGVAPCSPSTMTLTSLEHHHQQVASAIGQHKADNNNSLHQENRRRRATQHRYRKRPSSFDASLIIRNRNKMNNTTTSGLVTTSTPSTLMRQPAPCWDSTSTSGSSTDSSEDEFMYAVRAVGASNERLEEKSSTLCQDNVTSDEKCQETMETRSMDDDNPPEEFAMSAAEEAAFRMTIGRGHFSRSKKDRFLNNLRLEKRLNGLNKEFFEFACRAHTRSLRRRHSGDLRRIV